MSNKWNEIIDSHDMYQLLELVRFTYGEIFPLTMEEMQEYDGGYNPDHIYETLEMELIQTEKMDDFCANYDEYIIRKEESDPYHWRHRDKMMKNLMDKFGDIE